MRTVAGTRIERAGRGRPRLNRVSVEAVALVLDTLKKSGEFRTVSRSVRGAVLFVLEKLSRRTSGGRAIAAYIKQGDYRDRRVVRRVLGVMIRFGLLCVENLRAHYTKDAETKPPQVRHYTPAPALGAVLYVGKRIIPTESGYQNAEKASPTIKRSRPRSKVILHPDTCGGVKVPGNVVEAHSNGTGLRCGYERCQQVYHGFNDETKPFYNLDRFNGTCAMWQGVRFSHDELIPAVWEQRNNAALYARSPAVQSIPGDYRLALMDCEGRDLWRVDFSQIQWRILLKWLDVELDATKDYYKDAVKQGITRGQVKVEMLSMIFGRKRNSLWYKLAHKYGKDGARMRPEWIAWCAAEEIIARELPPVARYFRQPQEILKRNGVLIQRAALDIFYRGLSEYMEETGERKIGLPLHDGQYFGESDVQRAILRKAILERVSREKLGTVIPVQLDKVSPGELALPGTLDFTSGSEATCT